MKPGIYEHFHQDEREFVDRAWEWVANAGQYHEVKLTDFLDPRQRFILETLVNRHPDVHAAFEGGYADAERVRAIIAPDYRELDGEDFKIKVLSITSGDQKLLELEHGDYMGSILGLGIKRSKIGDIHVIESGCHAVVSEEIGSFLNLNLSQVHRVHVMTELLPMDKLQAAETKLETMDITVSSLRLDGIASDAHRISRTKIVVPIKAGRCRVNWKVEEDPSTNLKEGDVVSIQGMGRFAVLEIGGLTKKGRYRVKVGKYV
ncbi:MULTISPECIES: YlmH/Sll1252 family protein [Paenibacillus]|uniref:RNA-binding S4 domain protein n=2 Tax=Paenibacillus lactis TaxID=228574 RepID=G4HE99_9BACL|nr:YlmH/Sll1252 family protein [Paenibacillus lactis]EHB65168.1 RNA-binding S4 domain protein [Paenibacillus lactis 154]MBP1895220.1 RNA-binding protein YlmH [Paenibacillus lactis]MCM3495543.1 YlmH/Sll1252 family protein [Paenibacillus lactis]GIO90482.1 putative RNA-binding protein YlmH [Paenibacillus lactis]HAF99914.1 RNA-binding protein [Paenibacillus lactis]